MNPWDLLLWALAVGLAAIIAALLLTVAFMIIAAGRNEARRTRTATSTKEDIL